MIKNTFFAVFLTASTVAIVHAEDSEYATRHESNPAVQAFAVGVKNIGSAIKFAANEPAAAFESAKKGAFEAKDSVVSTVSPYVPQQAVDAKGYAVTTAVSAQNYVTSSTPYTWTVDKFAQAKKWAFPTPVVEEKSRFSKVWNANVFGYKGAGKYVIASTAAAAAIVAAYAAYCFAQPTLEDQVVALVGKAQVNPNVVLKELPGILAQCSNDDVRVEVLHYVLSQVVITPEIAAAFNLQQ